MSVEQGRDELLVRIDSAADDWGNGACVSTFVRGRCWHRDKVMRNWGLERDLYMDMCLSTMELERPIQDDALRLPFLRPRIVRLEKEQATNTASHKSGRATYKIVFPRKPSSSPISSPDKPTRYFRSAASAYTPPHTETRTVFGVFAHLTGYRMTCGQSAFWLHMPLSRDGRHVDKLSISQTYAHVYRQWSGELSLLSYDLCVSGTCRTPTIRHDSFGRCKISAPPSKAHAHVQPPF